MAAYQRRRGYGHRPTEREMNSPWRNNPSPRPSSPASPLLNGNAYSPHTTRKRESSAFPVDQEHNKNVEFLKREWQKVEAERLNKGSLTVYAIREQEEKESQPFDLEAFLENLHQRQQQQQQ